jgi:hypothetical protein
MYASAIDDRQLLQKAVLTAILTLSTDFAQGFQFGFPESVDCRPVIHPTVQTLAAFQPSLHQEGRSKGIAKLKRYKAVDTITAQQN